MFNDMILLYFILIFFIKIKIESFTRLLIEVYLIIVIGLILVSMMSNFVEYDSKIYSFSDIQFVYIFINKYVAIFLCIPYTGIVIILLIIYF